ncbi:MULTISPECIES: HalOD1 output domain-containing protein [Haloferacaceae]|uniref:HalOD1 output domain-containing protein n=1 Tax=Halorubrum glutamatedens TaxID=2707018 RepID=A0ABD5QS08_9EURY|nr:HalOD1 output domain-containing protein [Halobellus captivus]
MTDESNRSSNDDGSETTGVVHARYDWSSTTPSEAVIETVSIAVDRDPATFGSLYEAIDTDSLNTIFRPDGPKSIGDDTVVSFVFVERQISVHGSGDVFVGPNAPDG